jgi:hypothetical protein
MIARHMIVVALLALAGAGCDVRFEITVREHREQPTQQAPARPQAKAPSRNSSVKATHKKARVRPTELK